MSGRRGQSYSAKNDIKGLILVLGPSGLIIQWGLEFRTRQTDQHSKTEPFFVRFSNGSEFEWSDKMAAVLKTDRPKTD